MESIVGVMKKVAEHETRKLYTTELGVVTAVFPHTAENDKDNYQCSVKLRNKKLPDGKDFELREVPVATPYMGLVCIPNVGDLVLVQFIGGELNAPVITARVYNDEDRPPINNPQEFLLQHSVNAGGRIKLDAEGAISVSSKNEQYNVTVDDDKIQAENEQCRVVLEDNQVTVKNETCTVTLDGSTLTIDNGRCTITVASGGITLDARSNPITLKSLGTIKIGGPLGKVEMGGIMPGKPVCDGDQLIMSSHTHIGNLGVPCPVMVPLETVNSIKAKARNTQVG